MKRSNIRKLIAMVLGISLFISAASAQSQTRFVKYKNYLIPIGDPIARPDTPGNFSATKNTVGNIVVNYNSVPGVTHYQIELYRMDQPGWVTVYSGPSTSFVHSAIEFGHLFYELYYRVRACDATACSFSSDLSYITINNPPDYDGDGVFDALDQCLNTIFTELTSVDANGCGPSQRDTDGDGVIDPFDLCPGTPANTVVSDAGCEPTTVDTDNDGVTDDLDWCSGTSANPVDLDSQGCARDQIDSDNDGVVDYDDPYPFQNDFQCEAE